MMQAQMVPSTIMGTLQQINEGTQVSQIWSCCPSRFSVAVGSRAWSEAGDPASPNTAAAQMSMEIAGTLKPI